MIYWFHLTDNRGSMASMIYSITGQWRHRFTVSSIYTDGNECTMLRICQGCMKKFNKTYPTVADTRCHGNKKILLAQWQGIMIQEFRKIPNIRITEDPCIERRKRSGGQWQVASRCIWLEHLGVRCFAHRAFLTAVGPCNATVTHVLSANSSSVTRAPIHMLSSLALSTSHTCTYIGSYVSKRSGTVSPWELELRMPDESRDRRIYVTSRLFSPVPKLF